MTPHEQKPLDADHPHKYNHDHRHSGVAMHTPFDVHHGNAADVRQARAHVLTAA